jgi:hypothetical protein
MLKKGTISKVREFYINNPEYLDEIRRAFKTFFEQTEYVKGEEFSLSPFANAFFNEWLTYDFKFSDGKVMLEKYYYENPENIPDYRRKIYKDLMENYFGLFEVIEVKLFTGLKLRRIDDRKEFEVSEVSLTTQINKGDLFFSRVANVGERYELVGCDSAAFRLSEIPEKERLLQIKALSKFGKMTPIIALQILENYTR